MGKKVVAAIFIIGVVAVIYALQKPNDPNGLLPQRLAYLTKEVPEVAWVEYDDNDVYISFKERSEDMRGIVNAAAFNGNRAINFGVNVYATLDAPRGWRPGQPGFVCDAVARHGKIEKSC